MDIQEQEKHLQLSQTKSFVPHLFRILSLDESIGVRKGGSTGGPYDTP